MFIRALDAVIVTTTSVTIPLDNLVNVSIQILAADISSGNGVFTVLGSNDGINFKALSTLTDNATAITTAIASKTLSANGSDVLGLGPIKPKYIQVKVTRTTDGTYSAFVYADKLNG